MGTVLKMSRRNSVALPAGFCEDDVRSSEALVEYFIENYSRPGGVVFDPFAGFGTTVLVAERLGRAGYGIEYLEERADYIRSVTAYPQRVFCGSALELEKFPLPDADFSFTSPPYMSANDHPQYPFAAYRVTGEGYGQYLQDIKRIYGKLKAKMKKGAYAVIEVSNIINNGVMTPLAWDVAKSVGEVLTLKKEIIVEWEGDSRTGSYGYGYDHCYCLVFQNE